MNATIVRYTKWALAALVICLISSGMGWSQEQPQDQPKDQNAAQPSVADLAKEKPTTKKAKKVYTDDDMPSRPADTSSPNVSGNSQDQAAADLDHNLSGDKPKPKAEAKDDKAAPPPDNDQTRAAKAKAAALKQTEDAVSANIKRVQDNMADPNIGEDRRQMYQEMLNALQQKLTETRRERADAEAGTGGNAQPSQQPSAPPPQQ